MDCRTARETLWPPERPRLCEEEVAKAQAHVDQCRSCRLYFAQDRALLDAYHRLRTRAAPLEVRERVFETLARARLAQHSDRDRAERPRVRRRIAMVVASLAASLVLFGLFVFQADEPVPVEDPAIFAEDYLRRAVGEDQIVTSDPQEVRRFLQRELGRRLTPLQLAGLEVERAEVCLIRGRRGAVIVYRSEHGPISHYLIPWDGGSARAPSLADYREGSAADQMPVVTWSTPDLEHALVGDVEAPELMRLATLAAS